MLINLGDVLLSHPLAQAVPSGLRSLTTVFGMGNGWILLAKVTQNLKNSRSGC